MVRLEIVFLGTSSSVPTVKRGLTSIAVVRGGQLLLFDAGEGMQRSMIQSRIGFNRPTKVFVTHMHSDHVVGLLGLLQTMSMNQREREVHVYGPKGIRGFLEACVRYLKFGLTFPLYVNTVRQGLVIEEKEYVVRAALAEHSATTYAYLLEERARPGVFHPDKATELGVPKGELWAKLQQGKSVKIEGKLVKPRQVLGPARAGRRIGISGDTRPVPRLASFFKGADVVVFDSTYSDQHAEKATENMHSTAREAATIAKAAGAQLLILTHFSARYEKTDRLVSEASSVHVNVVAASDLMRIEVPYPKR